MAGKAQVVLDGLFPAGAKVELYARNGDYFPGPDDGSAVKSATVPKDSRLVFDGLEAGHEFWAYCDDVALSGVKVTAKLQPAARTSGPGEPIGGQQVPPAGSEVVSGPRNTRNARPQPKPRGGKKPLSDAEKAKRRSEASKKAAATRKRNAAKK